MSLINEPQLAALVKMAEEAPPGTFVEVGVYRGGSANELARVAREQRRELWLFDTFNGVPCRGEHDSHKIGDFGDTSIDDVKALIPDAQFVVGDCRFTLTTCDCGPIAFAHIDCDQYESIQASIRCLSPQMARGGVMWFDDYGAGLEGADRAINELLGDRIHRHECDKVFVRF